MDLEPAADAEAPPPRAADVSAAEYALGGERGRPSARAPLARRVLYEAATEPPHSQLTASGAPLAGRRPRPAPSLWSGSGVRVHHSRM